VVDLMDLDIPESIYRGAREFVLLLAIVRFLQLDQLVEVLFLLRKFEMDLPHVDFFIANALVFRLDLFEAARVLNL